MGVNRDQGKYKYCYFWSTSYNMSFDGSCFSFLCMLRITFQKIMLHCYKITYGRIVLKRGRFMSIIRRWMVGNWSRSFLGNLFSILWTICSCCIGLYAACFVLLEYHLYKLSIILKNTIPGFLLPCICTLQTIKNTRFLQFIRVNWPLKGCNWRSR